MKKKLWKKHRARAAREWRKFKRNMRLLDSVIVRKLDGEVTLALFNKYYGNALDFNEPIMMREYRNYLPIPHFSGPIEVYLV